MMPQKKEAASRRDVLTDPNHSLGKDPLTGKLRCRACGKNINNKCSQINSHCQMETKPGQPTKHAKKLAAWMQRGADDGQVKADLMDYYKLHLDESVPANDPDELLYRYRTAEAFVARPPFERMDDYRPLLQRSGHALTASTHLRAFIPKIRAAELDRLGLELRDQYIGIAFDGTTRLGEAINTTGRWCTAARHAPS